MKKSILFLLLTFLLVLSLSGCKNIINTEQKEVEVTITRQYHRGIRSTHVGSRKRIQPAKYHIYVDYDGVEYLLNGSETYKKFKDKIGEKIKAILITTTYDDGTISKEIKELMETN